MPLPENYNYVQFAEYIIATVGFGLGTYLMGYAQGKCSHHTEAIRKGFARFNEITGKREWRPLDLTTGKIQGPWNGPSMVMDEDGKVREAA
jgi:hypothetical protein